MASQAELTRQFNATDTALTIVERQLAEAQPGSIAQAQLQQVASQLSQQKNSITRQLNAVTTATNPPNPQISVEQTQPPPPPLVTTPATTSNPPDPQVLLPTDRTVVLVDVTTSPTVSDDAVSTGQGDPLRQLDDVIFLQTDTGLNILPEDVNITDVTENPQDGLVEFVAGGQRLVDEDATEFEISRGGLRILPEDIPTQTEVEDGSVVEFTQSGERIIDQDGFVITPSGLRVLPEDVD
jgi:hypothetical protein